MCVDIAGIYSGGENNEKYLYERTSKNEHFSSYERFNTHTRLQGEKLVFHFIFYALLKSLIFIRIRDSS